MREGACTDWGCYYATALDIEVDPQRRCSGSSQSDFALQAVVECPGGQKMLNFDALLCGTGLPAEHFAMNRHQVHFVAPQIPKGTG